MSYGVNHLLRNVTRPTFRIAPSCAAGRYQQIESLPQQLFLGVAEQLFGLSVDTNNPAVWAHNYHGVRGGFEDLSDVASRVKLRGGMGTHNSFPIKSTIQRSY